MEPMPSLNDNNMDINRFIGLVEPSGSALQQITGAIQGNTSRFTPLYNVCNTLSQIFKGYAYSQPITADSKNPRHYALLDYKAQDIARVGKQFKGSNAQLCLNILAHLMNDHFVFMEDFLSEKSIRNVTFEQFSTIINYGKERFKPTQPFCIQLKTGKISALERDHTTVILIKDGQIAYYDPKGIGSSERFFEDGISLDEGLEKINELFFNKTATIIENRTPHQTDCHNCGPLVVHYLYQRLIRGKDANFLDDKEIPIPFINHFRKGIAQYALNNAEKLINKNPSCDYASYELLLQDDVKNDPAELESFVDISLTDENTKDTDKNTEDTDKNTEDHSSSADSFIIINLPDDSSTENLKDLEAICASLFDSSET